MGKLLAICTSPQRGTVKTEVESARLTPEWGIETDAHGGNWHRQVSLLSAEKIENFRKKIWVDYGAFGENLVVEGYDFRNLPVTSRFAIGDVVLEMTQIGKECHNDCVIKQKTGECIMPREGVFARVLQGGEIHVGDEVTLLPPPENPPLRAAVITLSDKGSRGEREDKSGPLIVEMLTAAGYQVEETMILPDEAKALKAQLIRLADGRQVTLILTTGGTGFAPRDITPEATYAVADRNAPGIAEAMRYHSLSITPRGMLSRAASVLRGKTLIVNLPGSRKAAVEDFSANAGGRLRLAGQYLSEMIGNSKGIVDILAQLPSVADADGLIVRSDKVTREVIDAARNLKIVVRAGAGYDNVDLAACTERGIVVMNTPGQNSNAVAELVVSMMIFISRNQFTPGTGAEVSGKRLGIHAYGNVGRIVARYGRALGMSVKAFDPFVDPRQLEADGVEAVGTVEELYASSDYVSLHIPATAQTRGSIGYELLSSMPKGGVLINTARKEVIDEQGLIRAFEERADLKYITDIAAEAQPLLTEKFGKRVFATPKKMGAETAEANLNAGLAAARQTVDFLKNGNRRFQVNK